MVFSFCFVVSELARHRTVAAQILEKIVQTWIKFCGTTSIADALASVEAGADALGFIFAESKRRVTPGDAGEIIRQLPQTIERVGVFVNETVENILAIAAETGLTAAQLHGSESPEVVGALQSAALHGRRLRVIKTVLVDDGFHRNLERICNAVPAPDSILLDSGAGSGKTFDWSGVRGFLKGRDMRLIVAGGLTPENAADAVRAFRPWGVDVVTGVEREPRRKDPEKLKAFIAAVRRAENELWAAQQQN